MFNSPSDSEQLITKFSCTITFQLLGEKQTVSMQKKSLCNAPHADVPPPAVLTASAGMEMFSISVDHDGSIRHSCLLST